MYKNKFPVKAYFYRQDALAGVISSAPFSYIFICHNLIFQGKHINQSTATVCINC